MTNRFDRNAIAGSLAACARARAPGARAGAGRSLVLLPGRRRRADHQDHRRLRRRLREGEPRDQAQADLLGQLPGVDHQGADRGEERRAAGDVDPAVDRHVHADRRGRDRAVRPTHQDGRRPGVAQELLSRRSWRTARPAARPGASRSSARRSSSTTTRRCSRRRGSIPNQPPANWTRCSSTRRSSPSATRRARSRNGACRSRRRASRTGCSRRSRSRTAPT